MGDAGFFKGTSADQDSRFSNKEKKLLKSMTFPPEFDQKVDMKKVNLDVMRPWISTRITELLGFEDEVVIDFTIGLLEEEKPDPRRMQINLTGFLEKNTQTFILDLWKLLLSAQGSIGGVPQEFLEAKKRELQQSKRDEAERSLRQQTVMDAIRRRKEAELAEAKEESVKRSRFGDRGRSRSRSPPPRRSRFDNRSPPRRRPRSRERRRFRSPPGSSRSRSPSPRRDRSPRRSEDKRRARSPSFSPSRRDSRGHHRRRSPSPRRRRRHHHRSPSTPRRRERSPSTPRRYRGRNRSPSTPRRHRQRSISPVERRRDDRSPSTPRRAPDSSARRTPSPAREEARPPPGGDDMDEETRAMRERALASMKKRRERDQN